MVCLIQGSECDATYDVSTGYGFTIFKNCHSAELHKIVDAIKGTSESVRHQTVAGCIRMRPHENGGLGAISSLPEA